MKKSILFYSLVLLFTCGCSKKSSKDFINFMHGDINTESILEKTPKDIQPEGTFVNQGKGWYKSLTFKGKRTVVIRDAILGIDFPSEYDKDEEFLRVKTDKSDLLFEIISEDTIMGEGFAEGLYIKRKAL